jgi:hypothetical protein
VEGAGMEIKQGQGRRMALNLPDFGRMLTSRENDSIFGDGSRNVENKKCGIIPLVVWSAYAIDRPETWDQDGNPKEMHDTLCFFIVKN